MEKHLPLVSIVTIVYNGEKYIEETIRSVLSQTYTNLEYIIIDGGSSDNTLGIIGSFNDERIKWISEKDEGISDAFNKGIEMAGGEIIGIINSDDWYQSDAIQEVITEYIKDPNDIICGDVRLFNSETSFNIKRSSLAGITIKMGIWHPGMFVPGVVYKKIGLYEKKFKVLMDYDFVIRCHLAGVGFRFIEVTIANMRYGGVSNKLINLSMQEAIQIKNKHFGKKVRHYFEYMFLTIYFQLIIRYKEIKFK